MIDIIDIKEHSRVPKYQQIIDSVYAAITHGEMKKGDKLPSVNELLIEFDISRDTVVKAYDKLKQNGVIESVPGKGYYVKNDRLKLKARVFLLFNKLSAHKKITYDAFARRLENEAAIDFFIYDNNYRYFKELIRMGREREYTHYVIICHFEEGGDDLVNFLNQELPHGSLIILDKRVSGLVNGAASIYQDFEKDIYDALVELNPRLKKYNNLRLLFPEKTYHPSEIQQGFVRFCADYAYDAAIIENVEEASIEQGTVYINLMEDDLVSLIKKIKQTNFKVGEDIGIISYNDTSLKEVLLDGITVISTDFMNLGEKAADMILNNTPAQVENPFYVIQRNSL